MPVSTQLFRQKNYSQDVLCPLCIPSLRIYLSAIKEGRFQPAIYYDKQEPKEFSALELTYLSAYEKRLFPSVCEILRTYYSERKPDYEDSPEIRRS